MEAAVPAAPPAPAVQAVAKAGTPIYLEIVDTMSTRTVKRGDMFALRLAEPLVVDGRTLIPEGTRGVGQVVDVGKPGIGGKPAKIVLAGRRLEFEGTQIPIRSFFIGRTGSDETGASLAVGLAIGVVGIFVQGGHVVIPAGAVARAKLGQDYMPGAHAASAVDAKPSAENEGKL